MKTTPTTRNIIIATISGLLVLAADQLTKALAHQLTAPYEVMPFVRFMLYKNTGIAFSIPIPQTLIYVLIALVVGVYFMGMKWRQVFKRNAFTPTTSITLALIIAGATGNIIDRIRFGYVIDFISIWKFAVFNIADAAITIGIGIIIVRDIINERRKGHQAPVQKQQHPPTDR